MVVMFVDCCVDGGWYFPYYSYRRIPTGKEFFVPAGTLIAVKLLMNYYFHLCCNDTFCKTYAVNEYPYFHLVLLSDSFFYQIVLCC